MFDGTWVNERRSVMNLEQHDEAIVGPANGTTIGFVVNWPAGSVAASQLPSGTVSIRSLAWACVYQVSR